MINVNLGSIPNSFCLSHRHSMRAAAAMVELRRCAEECHQRRDQVNANAGTQVSNVLAGGGGDMTGVMIAVRKPTSPFSS